MSAKQPPNGIRFEIEKIVKINGDWNIQAAQLRIKYPSLTDNDLKYEAGRENEMIKSMEARLHMNRDEVIAIIEKNEAEKS